MSRLPRAQEYLKTGFTAEAASAARYRAFAARAGADGRPQLAEGWLALAVAKDALAVRQLEAAGQVHGEEHDLESAIAEERYENEALYPRMKTEVDAETAAIFDEMVAAQKQHQAQLEDLLDRLTASTGDISRA